MAVRAVRWGRSAYETPADRERLAAALGAVGVRLLEAPGDRPPPDAEVLVVHSRPAVDARVLGALPSLRLVVTATSGHEHVDVAAARARGVRVARCPLARRDAVVATTLAMGLAHLRALPPLQAAARRGRWARERLPALAPGLVAGLRVGLVGMGVIGRAAAAAWRALGAEVRFTDPAVPGGWPPGELLGWAELISLHCSRAPGVSAVLDAEALAILRPGAIVLNTARGGCLDLQAALAREDLRLGIDVFVDEPPPALARLAQREGILLTPHAAGYHPGLGAALAGEVAAAVAAWRRGASLPHEVLPPG